MYFTLISNDNVLFLIITNCITNEKVSDYRNNIVTNCRLIHGTVGKGHRTFPVARHQIDNKRKATSSLCLVKMIARLEEHIATYTKTKTQNLHKQ